MKARLSTARERPAPWAPVKTHLEISKATVQLLSEYTGRGPTKAHTVQEIGAFPLPSMFRGPAAGIRAQAVRYSCVSAPPARAVLSGP
jgi:hypothetical protein